MTNLLIVHTPAEGKQVAPHLPTDWKVQGCSTPARDLPVGELGIRVEGDFEPIWIMPPHQRNALKRVVRAMQHADAIYLAAASDEFEETATGELWAWQLVQAARLPEKTHVFRIAWSDALSLPQHGTSIATRPLHLPTVYAQQARRAMDRMVGYLVSPMASKALGKRVRVSRIESALHLLAAAHTREVAVQTQSSWTIHLKREDNAQAVATLTYCKGVELPLMSEPLAYKVVSLLRACIAWVGRLETSANGTQHAVVHLGSTVDRRYPVEFTTHDASSWQVGDFLPDLHPVVERTPPSPSFSPVKTLAELIARQEGDRRVASIGTYISTADDKDLAHYLAQFFAPVLSAEAVARQEGDLAEIAAGAKTCVEAMHTFWTAFQPCLNAAGEALIRGTNRTTRPLILHPQAAETEG